MSLTTPSKLRELQIKLYRKAKHEASTGAIARHQPLQSKWYSANWGKCSSAESGSNLVRESAVKPVGKPDALIGHVRFDERGWETGRRSGVSTRAHPRLYKVPKFSWLYSRHLAEVIPLIPRSEGTLEPKPAGDY